MTNKSVGFFMGVAISAALAQAAFAADLNVYKAAPAPVAPPAPWAGFYVGLEGGGAFGSSNHVGGGPNDFGDTTIGYKITGGLFGGTVGYNFRSGPWVYGLEGDFSWMNVDGSAHESA